jgi:Tfp pilus assembly protein PilF
MRARALSAPIEPMLARTTGLLILAAVLATTACSRHALPAESASASVQPAGYAGSSQCKPCHVAFYKKWSTSHHGTAMQPVTPAFVKDHLTPQHQPVKIGDTTYQAKLTDTEAFVEEQGPKGMRKLPMVHAMGGKNTFYLLTPLDRGRLQVLPVAYDIPSKKWYDTAASGVRMHAGQAPEAPLHWTDPAFTFNTSCYGCHVSQLRVNYNLATDTYKSTWTEPGINCESCHGPGGPHLALFKNPPATRPDNIGILKITSLTPAQRNETCAGCHSKMSPISPGYQPQQRFFDHYDLVGYENADFYPDGRDLGENYTYNSWLRSPCLKNATFDCIHCHTSSGRYKFATENPNGACLPCHQDKVTNVQAHSHHKADGEGGKCIACHMPKTRFAAMERSDHSMLPPTPATTLKYQSPNACNLCHKDRDAAWADAAVRKWHKNDYQKPVLERAALIEAARNHDWKQLPAMISYIGRKDVDPIFRVSMIRLLVACPDARKWPSFLQAMSDPSPLIRGAAAAALEGYGSPETRDALIKAAQDEYRLVRVRAAATLARWPMGGFTADQTKVVQKAEAEYVAALQSRPDDFTAHTNLGNYQLDRGDTDTALRSFETAIKLRPDSTITLVNASIAYSRAGKTADADRVLVQALQNAPDNGAANFNRGLLLAEQGKKPEAMACLRKALASPDTAGPAAYNLCVMTVEENRAEALSLCRQAVKAVPDNEKYVFTLAFYSAQDQDPAAVAQFLAAFVATHPSNLDTRMLLADLFLKSGRVSEAGVLYRNALKGDLDEKQRASLTSRLRSIDMAEAAAKSR